MESFNTEHNMQKDCELGAKPSKILLVEDHRIVERVTKKMLEMLHCEVEVAMDSKTALELIKKYHYDLIFMDVGLPDMNGDEISRRIRTHELRKGTHIPIIALTAQNDSQTQKNCLDAGMNAVLSKPLTPIQAEKTLLAFIPARKKHPNYQTAMISDEIKIIDFDYAKKLLGNDEKTLWNNINSFIESLPHEIQKLEEAYQQEDWQKIQAIANRLKGGASYCGTLRLQAICTALNNYMQTELTTKIPDFYQKMMEEIESLIAWAKANNRS